MLNKYENFEKRNYSNIEDIHRSFFLSQKLGLAGPLMMVLLK